MKKIIAKQVNPEYQESPLMIFDEWPENVIFDGNRDYRSCTTDEYDHIMEHFDDMAYEWDNRDANGYTLAELLRDYGFFRADGKSWTKKQRHEWRVLMKNYSDGEREEMETAALYLITGHKWDYTMIRGCGQGDWQYIYYDTEMYSAEDIEQIEMEYFNTGSEWIIEDGDGEIFSMYCYEWKDEAIRAEIANAAGVESEEVTLYKWEGQSYEDVYEIA